MFKKHTIFCISAIACLHSLPTLASNYIPCDGCSQAQMQSAALAHGIGWYVVGNVTSNYVEAFRVYSGRHANVIVQGKSGYTSSASRLYVDQGNMTSQDLFAFSSYVKFYNASPVGYHKQFNLTIVPPGHPIGVPNYSSARGARAAGEVVTTPYPMARLNAASPMGPMSVPAPGGGTVSYPSPGVNAYTVVNDGPAQNAFLEWLSGLTTYGISSAITYGTQVASVFHVTDYDSIPMLSFTVTFTDGSHIGVYVDTSQHPAVLKVNPDTAVDSHGNNIPASAQAVTGNGRRNYDFSGDGNRTDPGNMRNQIGGFGIDPPSTQRFACIYSPYATPQVHCVTF